MMEENRKVRYIRFVIAYNIVMLIPMLVISVSVLYLFHKQQRHKLDDEMRIVQERQEDFWNQQMSVIHAFSLSCKYDRKYNDMYSETPGVYFDIWEELSRQEESFPFADGIYLYDKKNGIILSSDGNMEPELFFTEICSMDAGIFEMAEEEEIFAARASFRADSRPGIVLVSPFRTWGKSGSEVKYLLYMVRDEKLSSQFGEEEKVTVILFGNEVLYSSGNWDTEEDWEEKNRRMLSSGDYYTYRTELGDRFEMISYIPESSTFRSMGIYIRGYALWLLCSGILGLILAVLFSRKRYQIFQALASDNERLEEERNSLRMESCLYELLSKEMTQGDALWKKCLESRIYVNRRYKFFIVLPDDRDENRNLYDWLEGQLNLYSVTNAYRIEVVEGILIYLICSDEGASELKGRIAALTGRKTGAGVGSLVTDVKKLRQSYKEAQKQLNKCRGKAEYPEREILSLKEAVEDGDYSREQLLLESIRELAKGMEDMAAAALLWDVARIYRLDTEEILKTPRGTGEAMAEFTRGFLLRLGDKIPKDPPPEEKNAAAGYRKRNIGEMLEYIQAHYLEDNFSVKYMASSFETSISNISHFFKKNMGVTISQYVEQIKLEKAKELLEGSDKKIAEIAQMLRYNNSTVFIEMFKKYEGITPGGYREVIWSEKR